MTKHLRRWLNEASFRDMGGAYDGVIQAVTEELVHNRFTGQRTLQPIIHFDDGWLLLPNLTQRKALIEIFGAETDAWVGDRIGVYLYRKPGAKRDEKRVRHVSTVASFTEAKERTANSGS